MSTGHEPSQVDAFVDGELDLAGQLAMERRLQEDAALRRRIEDARELSAALREGANYHAAPAALRDQVARWLTPAGPVAGPVPAPAHALAPASTPTPGALRRPAAWAEATRRWFAWRPLAATLGLATLIALSVDLAWLHGEREAQLADSVVASHVRSMLGEHLVDVASSDHHTVKPFLSSRLGFSPPVDELKLPGSVLLGARIDYLEGRPVAALVYRQGEHIVNSFVWAAKSADSAPGTAIERGYRMAHWSQHDMTHWVVSDVNPVEFDAVVQAIRRAGDAP
jgi:anti-sigma factor RsiW